MVLATNGLLAIRAPRKLTAAAHKAAIAALLTHLAPLAVTRRFSDTGHAFHRALAVELAGFGLLAIVARRRAAPSHRAAVAFLATCHGWQAVFFAGGGAATVRNTAEAVSFALGAAAAELGCRDAAFCGEGAATLLGAQFRALAIGRIGGNTRVLAPRATPLTVTLAFALFGVTLLAAAQRRCRAATNQEQPKRANQCAKGHGQTVEESALRVTC